MRGFEFCDYVKVLYRNLLFLIFVGVLVWFFFLLWLGFLEIGIGVYGVDDSFWCFCGFFEYVILYF